MRNLIIVLSILFLATGCTTKVIEPIYIKSKCPKLETYDNNASYSLGTVYNKGDKICVKRWGTCVPKSEIIELVKYTSSLKKTIMKYENQITTYNKYKGTQDGFREDINSSK